MPTLTFPMKHLKAVQSGEKTQTQRVSHTLHKVKVGAPAVLQFGARNAPTTIRTTVTDVEVLDYIAFADRLYETGDPRGDMGSEDLNAAIRESGTLEERRMLEVAQAQEMEIVDVCNELIDKTFDAMEDYARRKRILTSGLSKAEVEELEDRFCKRIVIIHFAPPAPPALES